MGNSNMSGLTRCNLTSMIPSFIDFLLVGILRRENCNEYLTGPQFRRRIQAIVEAFSSMQQDLDREKAIAGAPVTRAIKPASAMLCHFECLVGLQPYSAEAKLYSFSRTIRPAL